jgi:hypothetical protein
VKYEIVQAYVEQVRQQCQFVVMAHADLRAASARHQQALATWKRAMRERDWTEAAPHARARDDATRELWYAAQALMTAIANIDKALWLKRNGSEKGREPVRAALGVKDDSTSTEVAREIRNHLEHYDDNINRWAKSSEGLKIEVVGATPVITGHTDKVLWRGYDPAADVISFWGLSVELSPIEQEARRLIPIAEHVLSLCPQCVDEGKEHVMHQPAPGFPAAYDPQGSPAEDGCT